MEFCNPVEDRIERAFDLLSSEAESLYLRDHVPSVDSITPLELQREFIGPNVPLLVKGAVKHWPAIKKWSMQYLRETLGDKDVTIAVTPTGYADAIAVQKCFNKRGEAVRKECFVLPEERGMKMKHFVDILEKRIKCPGIFYLQEQNSNLTQNFQELLPDIDNEISWASEAFNEKPDAVNLWIGDSLAVTSMHKDPYENIYCVVSGYKDFILHAPTDRPWIPYKKYPVGRYKEVDIGLFDVILNKVQHPISTKDEQFPDDSPDTARHSSQSGSATLEGFLEYLSDLDICGKKINQTKQLVNNYVSQYKSKSCTGTSSLGIQSSSAGETELEEEVDTVYWICVDPLNPDYESYPKYRKAKPIKVRVNAGDALYLPSFWFHHVRQSHACIAVNFWYNMKYDVKYAYYRMVESLSTI